LLERALRGRCAWLARSRAVVSQSGVGARPAVAGGVGARSILDALHPAARAGGSLPSRHRSCAPGMPVVQIQAQSYFRDDGYSFADPCATWPMPNSVGQRRFSCGAVVDFQIGSAVALRVRKPRTQPPFGQKARLSEHRQKTQSPLGLNWRSHDFRLDWTRADPEGFLFGAPIFVTSSESLQVQLKGFFGTVQTLKFGEICLAHSEFGRKKMMLRALIRIAVGMVSLNGFAASNLSPSPHWIYSGGVICAQSDSHGDYVDSKLGRLKIYPQAQCLRTYGRFPILKQYYRGLSVCLKQDPAGSIEAWWPDGTPQRAAVVDLDNCRKLYGSRIDWGPDFYSLGCLEMSGADDALSVAPRNLCIQKIGLPRWTSKGCSVGTGTKTRIFNSDICRELDPISYKRVGIDQDCFEVTRNGQIIRSVPLQKCWDNPGT
jgi:hypothetical protein